MRLAEGMTVILKKGRSMNFPLCFHNYIGYVADGDMRPLPIGGDTIYRVQIDDEFYVPVYKRDLNIIDLGTKNTNQFDWGG